MSLKKYEIDCHIDGHRKVITIGNPNGDLKIVAPGIIYHQWPENYHPDAGIHPVQVLVETQTPAGNRQPLKFITNMADEGANLRQPDIFCVQNENGEIKRKRRGSVPVTSGGGGGVGVVGDV